MARREREDSRRVMGTTRGAAAKRIRGEPRMSREGRGTLRGFACFEHRDRQTRGTGNGSEIRDILVLLFVTLCKHLQSKLIERFL